MVWVNEASPIRTRSPENVPQKKRICANPNKISGVAEGCPCNYIKTYNMKLSRISVPLEIVSCEKACGLSGEVLGAQPGSRQALVQGRDLRRADQEEVSLLTPRYAK